ASRLRSSFSETVDVRVIYNHRASVLLMSGQENILKAWSECMGKQGGGLSVYFRPVADTDDKLWELHIEYLPATDPDKFNPRTLTLTRNARMDPQVAVVADTDKDKTCLNEGYKYRPTDNCTIKFVATDPWSSDTINITVTDGKNVKDIGAYLAPRAKL